MFTRKLVIRRLPVILNALMILSIFVVGFGLPHSTHAFVGFAIEVNTAVDNTIKDGLCSLREAIINANRNDQFHSDCTTGFSDDGIFFSDSLGTATIILTSPLPPITDSDGLLINGGSDITISGGNLHQVFSVTTIGNLTLDGLIVRKGKSQITNIGGAVWNAGTLVIRNCTFRDNYAKYGGAIFNGIAELTITNSNFQDNQSTYGGGVYNEGGQVTIQGGIFYGNSAAQGGAIKNVFASGVLGSILSINGTSFTQNISKYGAGVYNTASAQVNITNATFLKNNGGRAGGGIYNLGNLALDDSEISGNIAKTGGGIYNQNGILNITGSILRKNSADEGAGIYNSRGQLNMESSEILASAGVGLYNFGGTVEVMNGTFAGNQSHAIYNHGEDDFLTLARIRVVNSILSGNSGAGIYNDFGLSNIYTSTFQENGGSGVYNIANSVASIYKSSFIGNMSKFGGGIYNDHSDLFLHISTLYENVAFQSGGGLYNNGAAEVLGSTISNNTANLYDGLYNASSGDLELYNTIIAQSGGLGVDCTNAAGGLIIGNNNLIQSTGSAACDFIDGMNNNIIGQDANLEPLIGFPAYLPIGSTSPALDNGDDAKCFVVLNQSQNGVTRPQGAHCDIGSYEAPAKGK